MAVEDTLRAVLDLVQQYPEAQLVVEGHTDSLGSHEDNLELSRQRAASVSNWLAQTGRIEAERIIIKAWGETRPVSPNVDPDGGDSPTGRQKNRRVEIRLEK